MIQILPIHIITCQDSSSHFCACMSFCLRFQKNHLKISFLSVEFRIREKDSVFPPFIHSHGNQTQERLKL